MQSDGLLEILNGSPVIAAIKDPAGLEKCLASDCRVVFVLFGDLVGIAGIIQKIKAAGKLAFVHVDLIDGLSSRDVSVDFIAQNTGADGIITTKANLARRAKSRGLISVQRFFVIDSLSLSNIEKQMPLEAADLIEILPGVMPKIIRRLRNSTGKPIIAGGLIMEKEDILAALDAGALAISSTDRDVWFM
jgi:glycerol uptake operon antiterminator